MGTGITPAGPLDQILSRILCGGDLSALPEGLPGPFRQSLIQVISGQDDPQHGRHLAQMLMQNGLPAAALAALNRALACPAWAADHALVWTDMAQIWRAQGRLAQADAAVRVAARLNNAAPHAIHSLPELDDGTLQVQCAAHDPAGFAALIAGQVPHPLADDPLRDPAWAKPLFFSPHHHALTGRAEDYSFLVTDHDGQPVLLVECDLLGQMHLGCRTAGIPLIPLQPHSPHLAAARLLAVRQLVVTAHWAGAAFICLDSDAETPPDPETLRLLAHPDSVAIPYRRAWVDLGLPASRIEKDFRATTRQGIRWGRQNMTILPHDACPDLAGIYRDLHLSLGRRAALDPEKFVDLCRIGHLTAFVGFHQDQAVSMVISSRHGQTVYDSATLKKARDNLPLSHALIAQAIFAAQESQAHRFDFGPLWESGHLGDKLKAIALFKRGFANCFQNRRQFNLAV